jgi:hypothetical protein
MMVSVQVFGRLEVWLKPYFQLLSIRPINGAAMNENYLEYLISLPLALANGLQIKIY